MQHYYNIRRALCILVLSLLQGNLKVHIKTDNLPAKQKGSYVY